MSCRCVGRDEDDTRVEFYCNRGIGKQRERERKRVRERAGDVFVSVCVLERDKYGGVNKWI